MSTQGCDDIANNQINDQVLSINVGILFVLPIPDITEQSWIRDPKAAIVSIISIRSKMKIYLTKEVYFI